MDKVKKWVVDLADPMLKAYINYGHGLEEDGVSVTAKGIEFLAEFEPGLYPMYAIELREYVEHMGIAIEDVQEIHLVAAAYDENEEEMQKKVAALSAQFTPEELCSAERVLLALGTLL